MMAHQWYRESAVTTDEDLCDDAKRFRHAWVVAVDHANRELDRMGVVWVNAHYRERALIEQNRALSAELTVLHHQLEAAPQQP